MPIQLKKLAWQTRLLWFGLCAVMPSVSLALVFTPSEAEWARWPEYCRARYVASGAGETSMYAMRVTSDEVMSWKTRLGDGWEPLHHYCAGRIKVDRALAETDKKRRDFYVLDAIDEFRWYMQRVPNTHPIYADAAAQTCSALDKIGDTAEAMQYCDLAIKSQPENPIGYSAKATIFRRHKQLSEARDTLEAGNKQTDGKSAEIRYFLGLTYLELNDFSLAQENAREAYRLGYPLPGLRDRLSRAGHPID